MKPLTDSIKDYEFVENTKFEALMPKILSSGAPTIGVKGTDYLEVIDFPGFFKK